MPDRPIATTATHAVLYAGYASPGVAATVGFISDGQRRVVTDPGMVRHRSVILLGRRLLAIRRPGCPAPATIGVGAVIGALILMFHPAANAYIRGTTTRAPARRGSRQARSGGATR